MNATVNIICYRQKTLKNGKHPLMIRVAKNGKTKYKSLGISVHSDHWDFQKNRPLPKCPNRELILKIILEKEVEFQKEILELASMQKEYTASSLIAAKTNQVTTKSVGSFFEELVGQLKKVDRINCAGSFKSTWNSLKKFCGNDLDFPFSYLDVEFLGKYEQWLKSQNYTEVTMFSIFKNIRTAYNKAIAAKCTSKSSYPFEEFKLSKFDTKTQKRAISKDAIKKIMEVDLSNELYYTQFSRDMFIFSYLCSGINLADIARLKIENMKDNKLMYIRKKTKKKINTPLSDETLQIIQKYAAGKTKPSDYIFPIFDDTLHKTEVQKHHRLHKVLGKVNPSLKIVTRLAGLNVNLTTYVARHSFATVLKNSGVNFALISEALGHSDIATTQIYLDSFESEQVGEALKHLL